MIQLSVAVMAHRRREEFIPALLEALDRPAEVVWDQRNERWDTGKRAMLAHDPAATHHLVVQDDAIVCRDLVAGLEHALGHVPALTPLCLYVGRLTPFGPQVNALAAHASQNGTSWLSMDGLHWGVGIVMPVPFIGEMVSWGDRNTSIANYDRRIGRWLELRGARTWYPWPSLVDHRDSPSLVPGRGRTGRYAHRFLGSEASALDVDWSGSVLQVNALRSYGRKARRVRPTKERKLMAQVFHVSGEVMVARESGRVTVDGRPVRILRGRTFAHASSWIVAQRPQLWRPVKLDFPPESKFAQETPRVEAAIAAVVKESEPPASTVRAWAKEQPDIDVPRSGPLPAEIVERYKAAHEPAE